jgi:hydroxymethylbilane synthase
MNIHPITLRLGTRGSELALWQAHHVRDLLASRAGMKAEIIVIETRGDLDQSRALAALGSQGVFTKELENALLSAVDVAVHSLRHAHGLARRSNDRDPPADPFATVWWFARTRCLLRAAPSLASAGGSALLQHAGSADRGPARQRADAAREAGPHAPRGLVLAPSSSPGGLVRLGLDPRAAPRRPVDPRELVPAPAQGALALQVRTDVSSAVRLALSLLHDESTAAAVRAERAVLAGLRGGCNLPLGCHAVLDGRRIRLLSVLGRDEHSGPRRGDGRHPRPLPRRPSTSCAPRPDRAAYRKESACRTGDHDHDHETPSPAGFHPPRRLRARRSCARQSPRPACAGFCTHFVLPGTSRREISAMPGILRESPDLLLRAVR